MRARTDREFAWLRRAAGLLVVPAVALGLAACGSSRAVAPGDGSSSPSALLHQTFVATNGVQSGVLGVSIVVVPHGSSKLTTPLSLSLNGPFQSEGAGKPTDEALSVALSGFGKHATFGVTRTATGTYVSLEGTNYELPSTLSTPSGASGSKSPDAGVLGIDPEHWLSHPQIVGTATVDGVLTEHVHAAVDVSAFVASLEKALARESSLVGAGSQGASHLTAADVAKIAALVRNPSIDVYVDKRNSTLRRFEIHADVTVPGSASNELGGLTAAGFTLTINLSDLGVPQTITTPSDPQSFTKLESKLEMIEQGLSGLGATGLGANPAAGAASGTTTRALARYSKCVTSAAGDVTKITRCEKLLTTP